MAYSDFTLERAVRDLGIRLNPPAPLFDDVTPVEPDDLLARTLADVGELALSLTSEAARREMIVAPVLFALRRRLGDLALFPGWALDVDGKRGLKGFCDYLLGRSRVTYALSAPLLAVLEAKRGDVGAGVGQAAATMVGMREFNAVRGTPLPAVYGVVTSGAAWRFLRLAGDDLTPEPRDIPLSELSHILGMLARVCAEQPAISAPRAASPAPT